MKTLLPRKYRGYCCFCHQKNFTEFVRMGRSFRLLSCKAKM